MKTAPWAEERQPWAAADSSDSGRGEVYNYRNEKCPWNEETW